MRCILMRSRRGMFTPCARSWWLHRGMSTMVSAVTLRTAVRSLHMGAPHASPPPPTPKVEIKSSTMPTTVCEQIMTGEDDVHITDEKGRPVPVTPLTHFAELRDLSEWLQAGIEQSGYTTTMGIQKYTIPVLEQGHDLIGLAPTGSGKTVAFALPALKRIQPQRDGNPSILVLAPTRELVQQTTRVFEQLSCRQVRIAEAYGGASREAQARKLHNGCDVLVACPGRLKDFLDSGDVTLSSVSFLVFDEADRLLDMGFQSQLDDIVANLPRGATVQKMMWSATWPPAVRELASNYLRPERILIRVGTAGSGLQVNDHIEQTILFADNPAERVDKLAQLIEAGTIDENVDKLMIFVERQSDTEEAAFALSRRLGIDARFVGSIHGGLPQRQRDAVMQRFKNSQIRLLVATDVASRGLDIPDVTCVVNLQAPNNIDIYCHRIGRTGRAGRHGKAYTFVSHNDGGLAAELVAYLRKCNAQVPDRLLTLEQEYDANMQQRRWSKQRRQGRGGGGRARSSSRGRSSFGRRDGGDDRWSTTSVPDQDYW